MPDWLPVLDIDADLLPWLALAGLATGLLGLLLGLLAHWRVARLHRAWRGLGLDAAGADLFTALDRQRVETERLGREVSQARADADDLRAHLGDALRHVAVVRYDAFGDMGGRMSFSAALLDDAGDGLVLTSINGRSETRTYAKGVKGGASETELSPEERQVVNHARR